MSSPSRFASSSPSPPSIHAISPPAYRHGLALHANNKLHAWDNQQQNNNHQILLPSTISSLSSTSSSSACSPPPSSSASMPLIHTTPVSTYSLASAWFASERSPASMSLLSLPTSSMHFFHVQEFIQKWKLCSAAINDYKLTHSSTYLNSSLALPSTLLPYHIIDAISRRRASSALPLAMLALPPLLSFHAAFRRTASNIQAFFLQFTGNFKYELKSIESQLSHIILTYTPARPKPASHNISLLHRVELNINRLRGGCVNVECDDDTDSSQLSSVKHPLWSPYHHTLTVLQTVVQYIITNYIYMWHIMNGGEANTSKPTPASISCISDPLMLGDHLLDLIHELQSLTYLSCIALEHEKKHVDNTTRKSTNTNIKVEQATLNITSKLVDLDADSITQQSDNNSSSNNHDNTVGVSDSTGSNASGDSHTGNSSPELNQSTNADNRNIVRTADSSQSQTSESNSSNSGSGNASGNGNISSDNSSSNHRYTSADLSLDSNPLSSSSSFSIPRSSLSTHLSPYFNDTRLDSDPSPSSTSSNNSNSNLQASPLPSPFQTLPDRDNKSRTPSPSNTFLCGICDDDCDVCIRLSCSHTFCFVCLITHPYFGIRCPQCWCRCILTQTSIPLASLLVINSVTQWDCITDDNSEYRTTVDYQSAHGIQPQQSLVMESVQHEVIQQLIALIQRQSKMKDQLLQTKAKLLPEIPVEKSDLNIDNFIKPKKSKQKKKKKSPESSPVDRTPIISPPSPRVPAVSHIPDDAMSSITSSSGSTLLSMHVTSGASCHQCKVSKPTSALVFCSVNRGPSKKPCAKKYCLSCLNRLYHEQPSNNAQWECPSCRLSCVCASCSRKLGKPTVSDTAHEASQEAHKRKQEKRELKAFERLQKQHNRMDSSTISSISSSAMSMLSSRAPASVMFDVPHRTQFVAPTPISSYHPIREHNNATRSESGLSRYRHATEHQRPLPYGHKQQLMSATQIEDIGPVQAHNATRSQRQAHHQTRKQQSNDQIFSHSSSSAHTSSSSYSQSENSHSSSKLTSFSSDDPDLNEESTLRSMVDDDDRLIQEQLDEQLRMNTHDGGTPNSSMLVNEEPLLTNTLVDNSHSTTDWQTMRALADARAQDRIRERQNMRLSSAHQSAGDSSKSNDSSNQDQSTQPVLAHAISSQPPNFSPSNSSSKSRANLRVNLPLDSSRPLDSSSSLKGAPVSSSSISNVATQQVSPAQILSSAGWPINASPPQDTLDWATLRSITAARNAQVSGVDSSLHDYDHSPLPAADPRTFSSLPFSPNYPSDQTLYFPDRSQMVDHTASSLPLQTTSTGKSHNQSSQTHEFQQQQQSSQSYIYLPSSQAPSFVNERQYSDEPMGFNPIRSSDANGNGNGHNNHSNTNISKYFRDDDGEPSQHASSIPHSNRQSGNTVGWEAEQAYGYSDSNANRQVSDEEDRKYYMNGNSNLNTHVNMPNLIDDSIANSNYLHPSAAYLSSSTAPSIHSSFSSSFNPSPIPLATSYIPPVYSSGSWLASSTLPSSSTRNNYAFVHTVPCEAAHCTAPLSNHTRREFSMQPLATFTQQHINQLQQQQQQQQQSLMHQHQQLNNRENSQFKRNN